MSRRIAPQIIFAILVTMACTTTAGAQSQHATAKGSPEVGLRFGRDFSLDKWGVGGHVLVPLAGTIELRPSADLDLGMDQLGDAYQLNGDLALRGARNIAYLGGGIAYVHRQFDSGKTSGTGFNLFLGFKPLPRQGSQIYLEGRWTRVNSESIIRASIGVAFHL
ncbi:MAG: hypothetical protein ABI679_05530 [Gemmatimonadota bacterium]